MGNGCGYLKILHNYSAHCLVGYFFLQIRNMKHENVNQFVGAVTEAPNVAILMLYAPKGSLEVIITLVLQHIVSQQ